MSMSFQNDSEVFQYSVKLYISSIDSHDLLMYCLSYDGNNELYVNTDFLKTFSSLFNPI